MIFVKWNRSTGHKLVLKPEGLGDMIFIKLNGYKMLQSNGEYFAHPEDKVDTIVFQRAYERRRKSIIKASNHVVGFTRNKVYKPEELTVTVAGKTVEGFQSIGEPHVNN